MEKRRHSLKQKTKYLSIQRFYNEILNNRGEILIFDFRAKSIFDEKHFSYYSINIPYDDERIEKDFLVDYNPKKWGDVFTDNKEIKSILNKIKRYFIVIVYNNTSINIDFNENENDSLTNCQTDVSFNSFQFAFGFYHLLERNKVRELGIFNDKYLEFLCKYDSLIVNSKVSSIRIFSDPYPTCILDFKLFVGDESHARSIEVLRLLNITHIVNATRHAPNLYENQGIVYHRVDIEDHDEYDIYPYFNEVYDFIENAFYEKSEKETTKNEDLNKEENSIESKNLNNYENVFLLSNTVNSLFKNSNTNQTCNILIHCSLGVSRSPTLAIMYVMKKFKLSFSAANELVTFHRMKSAPIQKFLSDLELYEKNNYK